MTLLALPVGMCLQLLHRALGGLGDTVWSTAACFQRLGLGRAARDPKLPGLVHPLHTRQRPEWDLNRNHVSKQQSNQKFTKQQRSQEL